MLPNSCLFARSSRVSDHCSLLIAGQASVKKFKGFRFEAFWPRLLGFFDVVQSGHVILRFSILFWTCTSSCKRPTRPYAHGLEGWLVTIRCCYVLLLSWLGY
jgi:hypothetical protein